MKSFCFYAMLCAFAGMTACQKTGSNHATPSPGGDTLHIVTIDSISTDTATQVPFPKNTPAPSASCPAMPIYGDSIVYPQPGSAQDVMLTPLNNPGPGMYFSWPAGMVINHTTGAIDLSQSQTGLKYMIGFVPNGTTDTCMSTLIIGGASYMDSIYQVSNGGVTAVPYFDANASGGSSCDGPGNSNACKFDVTGSALKTGVFVNKSSGDIDLKKTLYGEILKPGVFGFFPVDGQTVTATISYQLKKGSNNAQQQISIQFIFYSTASKIPAWLLNSIDSRLTNTLDGGLISTSTNPRPPLVVIVRGF